MAAAAQVRLPRPGEFFRSAKGYRFEVLLPSTTRCECGHALRFRNLDVPGAVAIEVAEPIARDYFALGVWRVL